jgi:hypothetical protein
MGAHPIRWKCLCWGFLIFKFPFFAYLATRIQRPRSHETSSSRYFISLNARISRSDKFAAHRSVDITILSPVISLTSSVSRLSKRSHDVQLTLPCNVFYHASSNYWCEPSSLHEIQRKTTDRMNSNEQPMTVRSLATYRHCNLKICHERNGHLLKHPGGIALTPAGI